MKVAVIGLGMEGKNSVKALLDYEYDVYASDLDENIVIPELANSNLTLDLGQHDMIQINSADAVVLSPSLCDKAIARKVIENHKLLSDILTNHKSVLTIGITGTNGKTTTCYMLRDILEESGMKVLLGGNAGGGFEGYTKLVLEASKTIYDVIIVEICDMTLDFASYVFDIDMVIVTNIGYDHMDFHGTLENYSRSVCKFLKHKKIAILNEKDKLLTRCAECADKTFVFGNEHRKLKIYGAYNQENASGASKAAELLDVPYETINNVLKNFSVIGGRTSIINTNGLMIVVGKTDNPDAIAAVLNEAKMDVIIIGTPRKNETWRYNILKEVSNAKPSLVVLFPGLDSTTDTAAKHLRLVGYSGNIIILENVSEVIELAVDCTKKYHNIFIGGNGQQKIMLIQDTLQKLLQFR